MTEVSATRAVVTCARISLGSRVSLGISSPRSPLRDVFNDGRNALPTANAQRGNAILQVVAPQLMHKRDRQSSAAGRQGMPNGDGSSIYICLIPLQAQLFLNRQVLC